MYKVESLKCPNCGAALKSTQQGVYKCEFCNAVLDIKSSEKTTLNTSNNHFVINANSLIAYNGSEPIVRIPNGIKKIEAHAFEKSNVSEIEFPDSLEEIGMYAFADCTHITKISIPNNVRYIGNRAFWRCFNLENISCPDNTRLGDGVFLGTAWYIKYLDSLR